MFLNAVNSIYSFFSQFKFLLTGNWLRAKPFFLEAHSNAALLSSLFDCIRPAFWTTPWLFLMLLLCIFFFSCMHIMFFAAQYFIPYRWSTCKGLSAWQSFSVFFKNNLFKHFLIQISALCSLEQGTYLIFKYKEFLSRISKSIFQGWKSDTQFSEKLKICKISTSLLLHNLGTSTKFLCSPNTFLYTDLKHIHWECLFVPF